MVSSGTVYEIKCIEKLIKCAAHMFCINVLASLCIFPACSIYHLHYLRISEIIQGSFISPINRVVQPYHCCLVWMIYVMYIYAVYKEYIFISFLQIFCIVIILKPSLYWTKSYFNNFIMICMIFFTTLYFRFGCTVN